MFKRIRSLARNLFRRDHVERDLDAEVRGYTALLEEEKMSGGMKPPEARRAARMEMGGLEQLKEEVRAARAGAWLESLWQDIHFGTRMLCKNPGFATVAMFTLALGIGANTAIFSLVNAVLLEPLPFSEPGRLVQLWQTEAAPGAYPLTGPDYLSWQSEASSLEEMTLYTSAEIHSASDEGETEAALIDRTQANFFLVLGTQPALGRTFADGEDQPARNHVAILSDHFWREHYVGRPEVIGKSIHLDGETYVIIGIMPRWFNFPAAVDIWTPMDMSQKNLNTQGSSHQFLVIGRLRTGVKPPQVQAELTTILQRKNTDSHDRAGAVAIPLKEQLTGSSAELLYILLGAVALVLLIACANIANLLLARSSNRHCEIAMRAALGASRGRLVRQLITESILLALAGGVAGLLGARWAVDLMQSAKTLPVPQANPITLDHTVLLFTLGVSILVGVLSGLAPALQISALNLNDELKSSGNAVLMLSGNRRLLRNSLVVGEIAVSIALLIGAGLLLRSFARERRADIGVEPENVLTFGIQLPATQYTNVSARREFFNELVAKIQHIPGVQSVAISSRLPLLGGNNGYVSVEGEKDSSLANQLVEWNYITPDYFHVFGIPFYQGRNFTPDDEESTAGMMKEVEEISKSGKTPNPLPADLAFVSVINRAMARTFWPNQSPIGKVFNIGLPVRVIGVVGDVNEWSIRDKAMPEAYFPHAAYLDYASTAEEHVVVKTRVPSANVLGAIRSEVHTLDGGLALFNVRTMNGIINDSMQGTTFQTLLLASFAALGMLLAAIGIYGVMAYLVSQRTHEIGLRMALGAQRRDILRLILGEGAVLTLIGLVIGVGAALELGGVLRAFLFGVSATDPLTFFAVTGLLGCVALLACYIPARRAMRVDPMVALRHE